MAARQYADGAGIRHGKLQAGWRTSSRDRSSLRERVGRPTSRGLGERPAPIRRVQRCKPVDLARSFWEAARGCWRARRLANIPAIARRAPCRRIASQARWHNGFVAAGCPARRGQPVHFRAIGQPTPGLVAGRTFHCVHRRHPTNRGPSGDCSDGRRTASHGVAEHNYR